MVSLLKKIIIFRGGEGKQKLKHFWKMMIFCISKADAWPNGATCPVPATKRSSHQVTNILLNFTLLPSLIANSTLSKKGKYNWAGKWPALCPVPGLAKSLTWPPGGGIIQKKVFSLYNSYRVHWHLSEQTLASFSAVSTPKVGEGLISCLQRHHHGKDIWHCWPKGWVET